MNYAETLDAAMAKFAADKIGDRRSEQQKWEKTCFQLGAPGQEADRKAACQAMAERIGKNTPQPARVFLMTQLERIGKEECVAALAENLKDANANIRDSACRALARNPADAAGDALRKSLKMKSEQPMKAELINALGYRAENTSVESIAPYLTATDQSLATSAARALAKVATPAAAKALAAAREKASGELRLWVSDAYLLCADAMAGSGDKKGATAIYKQLGGDGEPKSVQTAAAHALAQLG